MIDTFQITIRIMLAALFSGIIGYEREVHGRAAGLRTTILVGVGSCLVMITSMNLYEIYHASGVVDPSRMAAQVVSGIGFLGAGTIIRFQASVRGLTTAAGLWAVAGIGLAVGSGFYTAALLTTAIIFIVLVTLSRFERRIKRQTEKRLKIQTNVNTDQLAQIRKRVTDLNAEIIQIDINPSSEEGMFSLSLDLKLYEIKSTDQIIEALLKIKGVTSVQWF